MRYFCKKYVKWTHDGQIVAALPPGHKFDFRNYEAVFDEILCWGGKRSKLSGEFNFGEHS